MGMGVAGIIIKDYEMEYSLIPYVKRTKIQPLAPAPVPRPPLRESPDPNCTQQPSRPREAVPPAMFRWKKRGVQEKFGIVMGKIFGDASTRWFFDVLCQLFQISGQKLSYLD